MISKSLLSSNITDHKIIFTLKQLYGVYNKRNFSGDDVNNRCNEQQIQNLFNDIYITTDNFAIIRKKSQLMLWAIFIYFFVLAIGLIIELTGLLHETIGDVSFIGFGIVLGSSIIYLIVICIATFQLKKGRLVIFHQIQSVIERNREKFENMGLRWNIPEHCCFIELYFEQSYLETSNQLGESTY